MKAVFQRGYGAPDAVLELREIDRPVAKDDEVLVQVHAASLHPDVWHMVRGVPYVLRIMGGGLRRPKTPVPGTDVAGVVEAVGRNVTRFKPGDEVFGETVKAHQWTNGGAYAQYVAVSEDALALKPGNMSFEEAAAVPTSALIALHAVRMEGKVQAGQKVLVNGAGGGVGAFALQLAKAYGAHVTGVDSTKKLDLLRLLGADRVVDYTKEDFTGTNDRYDVIVDVPMNRSFAQCRRVLARHGTYVMVGHDHYGANGHRVLGLLPRVLGLVARSRFVDQLPNTGFSLAPKRESMTVLKGFLEAGKISPPIDRSYPLERVSEAIRYLEEGNVLGKVVITV